MSCQHEGSIGVLKYPIYHCTRCGALFKSVWDYGPKIVPMETAAPAAQGEQG